ncbi:hypothetical protein HOY80DRAFT_954567 [Tuber brumale]|nr:hypothetical protein HOY80DRAFT_954567 [Tuber brumale]
MHWCGWYVYVGRMGGASLCEVISQLVWCISLLIFALRGPSPVILFFFFRIFAGIFWHEV